jgi:hypothetical protein
VAAKNADKELKNQEMLIHTSKHKNNPIARLDCTYDTKRLTKEKQQSCACLSHFDHAKYLKHTDICVGARVAISTVTFLQEVGLYNGSIGNVVETQNENTFLPIILIGLLYYDPLANVCIS